MVRSDISVGYIIINDKKEFLLLKKAIDGIWDFPKGHIKEGETNEHEVALRELFEETGITHDVIKPIVGFRHEHSFINPQGVSRKIILYLAICNRNPILSNEHSSYLWAGIEKAKELMVYPEKIKVLDAAAHRLCNDKLSRK